MHFKHLGYPNSLCEAACQDSFAIQMTGIQKLHVHTVKPGEHFCCIMSHCKCLTLTWGDGFDAGVKKSTNGHIKNIHLYGHKRQVAGPKSKLKWKGGWQKCLSVLFICTSFRQRVVEDSLHRPATAPIAPADPAAVLTNVWAEDAITTYMLWEGRSEWAAGSLGVMGNGAQSVSQEVSEARLRDYL